MVDGRPAPMPTVKKWGQYWYPASLVGFNRGIEFAYDHATNKLYADGSVLDLDTLVVDGVVYVPLQPQISNADLRPGMAMLEARRAKYDEMQAGMPEREGNTDMLFMENSVDMPDHPWAESSTPYQPTGPIIDLDPTGGNGKTPAHIRTQGPSSYDPSGPLPGHIPRTPPTVQEAPPTPPGAGQGIPLRVSTHGGPETSGPAPAPSQETVPVTLPAPNLPAPALQTSSSPTGLQPIPVAVAPAAGPGVSAAGAIAPCRAKNQAFEILVVSGSLQNNASDRLLALKLNQKNLSPVAQANLGSFALRCQDGTRLEPVKSRSVMPDGTLAPGGIREGELLFRLGPAAEPKALELEGTLPLSVPLAR